MCVCVCVCRWCRQPELAAALAELSPRLIVPSGVSSLIDLPHEYSDLILQVRHALLSDGRTSYCR